MSAILECNDLSAGIGSVVLLRNVTVSLQPGEVLAVIGPNGAGKTTFVRALCGLLPRKSGDVTVAGHRLPSGHARAANRAGLVFVPGDRSLFTTLTVGENIELATKRGNRSVDHVLERFPMLKDRWNIKAGAISGGEQQMVAMARGLIQRPKILMVDELSMGLAPSITTTLMSLVRKIADDTGTAIILIEQHVRLALEVADSTLVLVRGNVAMQCPARELLADMDSLERIFLEGLAARIG